MTKEIQTESSLWRSVFGPGVRPVIHVPAIKTIRYDVYAELLGSPIGRYLHTCRNLGLIQRLLEAGRDDKIKRLLFLPTVTQESQAGCSTSDCGSQTTMEPTSDSCCQTATDTCAAVDVACQTADRHITATVQTMSHCTDADSQTSIAVDASCQTADAQHATTCVQTSQPERAHASHQTSPMTTSSACQTVSTDTDTAGQQAKRSDDAFMECETNVAADSQMARESESTPRQMILQAEVSVIPTLISPRAVSTGVEPVHLKVGTSPTSLYQEETDQTVPVPTQAYSATNETPPLQTEAPVYGETPPPNEPTQPAAQEVVPQDGLWAPFTCLEKQVAHNLPPAIDLPPDVRVISPGDLDLKLADPTKVDVIAAGGCGFVFPVRDVVWASDYPLLCKNLRDTDAGALRMFEREIAIMQHLHYSGVIPRLYGVLQKTAYLPDNYFVMEHIAGGRELCDLVQQYASLSTNLWMDILIQIAKGLKVIHVAGVVHNDIKFDNIIVSQPTPATVKAHIIDFGLASFGPVSLWNDLAAPKQLHLAPELYEGKLTSPCTDIYSLGLIIEQVMNHVIKLDNLAPLKDACMDPNPDNRPSIDILINFLKFIQNTL